MLHYSNGLPFSVGTNKYIYKPARRGDTTPRIFLTISIEGIDTIAFLDTGAPYVVCAPQLAEALHLDPRFGESVKDFLIRGTYVDGYLHRITITLLADAGESLSVDATVFVPNLGKNQEWDNFPSVVGLTGFLERIRYAVDPGDDRFYFGGIEE